jgi:hypothetical protein
VLGNFIAESVCYLLVAVLMREDWSRVDLVTAVVDLQSVVVSDDNGSYFGPREGKLFKLIGGFIGA